MAKLNPNIIRVGDKVRVVIPQIFDRCGYPLSYDDALDHVEKTFSKEIDFFLTNIERLMRGEVVYETSVLSRSFTSDPDHIHKTNEFCKVLNALAYMYVGTRRFGGNERRVYTRPRKHYKDQEYYVSTIRFVKTGLYNPPQGYYDDYDPGYLSNERAHKILGLNHFKRSEAAVRQMRPIYPLFEIEATNVEKIHG